MTKVKQNNKGITLIALVVTIVILLILAGISITALFGENGLIERAKIADQKTKKEGAKEQIKLGIIAWRAEHYGADIDQDTLMDVINNITGATVAKNEETGEIDITINGETFAFTEILDEYIKEPSKKFIDFSVYGVQLSCEEGTTWYEFAYEEYGGKNEMFVALIRNSRSRG